MFVNTYRGEKIIRRGDKFDVANDHDETGKPIEFSAFNSYRDAVDFIDWMNDAPENDPLH